MAEIEQPGIVDLVDAGVPADQGLSSLGLLMQLAGHALAACAVFLFALVLIVEGMSGSTTLWLFAIFAVSCLRSLFHLAAGKQLVYGEAGKPGGRLAGIRRYITFAFVHSIAFAAILHFGFDAPSTYAFGAAVGLSVWPTTLLCLLQLPRFRRFDAELPITEDKGFEGASILMTVLGFAGAIASALLIVLMLDLPGSELQRGPNILLVLSLMMLFVRSLLHAHAGLSGLRTTSLDHSVELSNRYANFGVISAFCTGGAMLLYAMSTGMHVIGLAIVCCLSWLLLAWPLIIRRFFADRQFADLLAGPGATLHRRAPDAGLTWLGWLLLALAAWNASFLVPNLVMSHSADVLWSLIGGGTHSLWWNAGLVIVQGWAGFELIRMSPQSKMIATAYGIIAIALTLFLEWPMIEILRHLITPESKLAIEGPGVILMLGPIVIALIVPVATIVLVHRKIAPTARARYRPAPTPATP